MACLAGGKVQHIQAAGFGVAVIIFSVTEGAGAIAAAAQLGKGALCIHGVKHLLAVLRHGDDKVAVQLAKAIQRKIVVQVKIPL